MTKYLTSYTSDPCKGPVHLTIYTTKVLLYRALMHPATKEAKTDPHSSLRIWFHDALEEFAEFAQFLSQITTEDLNGFWGRRKYSTTIYLTSIHWLTKM